MYSIMAENTWFEKMGFSPYDMCSTTSPAVLGIQETPFQQSYYDFALPSEHIVACEFEKQRVEMDWFIQLESERLRRSILDEESRLQTVAMQQYESTMQPLIMQKDEEIAIARSRMRNLQDLLKKTEMEARVWENAAREREAIVSDLNNRWLNVAKERENEGDAMSFCDSSSSSRTTGGGGGGETKMVCKLCQFRRSCVVLLPCKHLCCCKLCETLLDNCPLCHTLKNSSLEAFLPLP